MRGKSALALRGCQLGDAGAIGKCLCELRDSEGEGAFPPSCQIKFTVEKRGGSPYRTHNLSAGLLSTRWVRATWRVVPLCSEAAAKRPRTYCYLGFSTYRVGCGCSLQLTEKKEIGDGK